MAATHPLIYHHMDLNGSWYLIALRAAVRRARLSWTKRLSLQQKVQCLGGRVRQIQCRLHLLFLNLTYLWNHLKYMRQQSDILVLLEAQSASLLPGPLYQYLALIVRDYFIFMTD